MNSRSVGIGCALAALAAACALDAAAQNPSRVQFAEQTIVRQLPDGRIVQEKVQVPVYRYGDGQADTESQKLLSQEQTAAQEARTLSAQLQAVSEGEQAELKEKLREKLAAIFDLQQQRRTREITKIEDRLAKLKEVLKKRDAAKDSIVDRRLETLTSGVDELGWEESFPASANPYNPGSPGRVPNYLPPATAPRAESFALPDPVPVAPPAVAPAPVPPAPPAAPRR